MDGRLEFDLRAVLGDEFEHYMAKIKANKRPLLERIKDLGVTTAKANAPSGKARKDYGSKPKLRDSIEGYVEGDNVVWYTDAVHARPQEHGWTGAILQPPPGFITKTRKDGTTYQVPAPRVFFKEGKWQSRQGVVQLASGTGTHFMRESLMGLRPAIVSLIKDAYG